MLREVSFLTCTFITLVYFGGKRFYVNLLNNKLLLGVEHTVSLEIFAVLKKKSLKYPLMLWCLQQAMQGWKS